MQISCFIQSSILTPYVWNLSNDLDFSEPNFITKIPYFRSSKGPNKTCFLIRELQMRKIFHWHYVLTQIWYLEQEPKMGSSKNFCPLWRNYAPWRNKVIWQYPGNGWILFIFCRWRASFRPAVRKRAKQRRRRVAMWAAAAPLAEKRGNISNLLLPKGHRLKCVVRPFELGVESSLILSVRQDFI
jgi:hypothetical protein